MVKSSLNDADILEMVRQHESQELSSDEEEASKSDFVSRETNKSSAARAISILSQLRKFEQQP